MALHARAYRLRKQVALIILARAIVRVQIDIAVFRNLAVLLRQLAAYIVKQQGNQLGLLQLSIKHAALKKYRHTGVPGDRGSGAVSRRQCSSHRMNCLLRHRPRMVARCSVLRQRFSTDRIAGRRNRRRRCLRGKSRRAVKAERNHPLSLLDGLVRADRWCIVPSDNPGNPTGGPV